MGRLTQIILLLLVIIGTVWGVLYFIEYEGIADISGTIKNIGGNIPWAGKYIKGTTGLPASEIAEIEELQAEKAREDRWMSLKKKEEELMRAERTLNEDRDKLSQWEKELERREEAISAREKSFTNREAQFEKAVKFYLTMRPASAAKVLSQQDDLLIIEIFRRMPERNVAAILAEMDPAVAGSIMRKMSR